jgi:hypothetical protein
MIVDLFKQPPIIAAIIAIFGAAIIVPLVKKFYFDARSRLRVEVTPGKYQLSEALKKFARAQMDVAQSELFSPARTLVNYSGYATVKITNVSKKKISGVSIMASDETWHMIWQINDADELTEVKRGQALGLGDIQPKHSCTVHVWTPADISNFNFSILKKLFRLSADELDSVHFRFPMPNYLRWKYLDRLMLSFIFLLAAAALSGAFYLLLRNFISP